MQLALPMDLPIMTPRSFFVALAEKIAAEFGLTYQDLRGPLRLREYVNARRKLSLILRHKHNWSLPRIGNFLNRDHSSIHNLLHPKKQLTGTTHVFKTPPTLEVNSCPTSVC